MGAEAEEGSRWQLLGGDSVMSALLADFYLRIDRSDIRALFPEDLEETLRKQFAFQSDLWGGPARYAPWRGPARLRLRHLPFPIGDAEAATWMRCMREATHASAMPAPMRDIYLEQLERAAQAMINREPPEPAPGS